MSLSLTRRALSRLTRRARRPAAGAMLATLVGLACSDAPTSAGDEPEGRITVNAALTGTDVRALTVLVSGPAIATPIVSNVFVDVDVPSATLTMQVPVGGQRTFLARGYDAAGLLTHEGMGTVTVRPGTNAPLAIRMYPRTGDQPITIGVGSYGVAITPSPLAPATVGQTLQLTAAVTDNGVAVPGPTVTWASLNPVVASVSATGLVTAHLAGTTTIYVAYRGAAASVDLTVGSVPQGFTDITVGAWFTCGLRADGAAYCWGRNASGQLGDGTGQDRLTPVPVVGGHRFVSLSAGQNHACGVTSAGEGWCWGFNGNGTLGSGVTAPGATPVPQRVTGSHVWSSIQVGSGQTCGLTTGGDAWCWGMGIPGSLGLAGGDGTAPGTVLPSPTQVTVPGAPWSSLSVRSTATCGIRASDASAVCSIRPGELVTTASAAGVQWLSLRVNEFIYAPSIGPFAFRALSTFACGRTTGREVLCWGESEFGEVGAGPGVIVRATPGIVPGPQDWDDVVTGSSFACALRDGAAYCWGRNDFGQLGDGTFSDREVPTAVATGQEFIRLSAGMSHACGVRVDGRAMCWGANVVGELGDGTTTTRSIPTLVSVPVQP